MKAVNLTFLMIGLFLTGFPVFGKTGAYVEGEVLVLYKTHDARKRRAVPRGQQRRIFAALSQESGRTVQWVRHAGRRTEELLADFSADPDVACVSPNYIKKLFTPTRFPNDAYFSDQWALHNTGQSVNGVSGTADADIDFPEARRLMLDAVPDVVVALIDSGVDYTHPDLAAAMWVNPGEIADNGIDDDGNGFVDDVHGYDFSGDDYIDDNGAPQNDGADSDPMDLALHGTHVAGIIAAAAGNGFSGSGVGRVRIMALKASADGDDVVDSDTLAAMNYMVEMKARGIPIVAANASYGAYEYSAVEHSTVLSVVNAGIILCAAAGNDTSDNDVTPAYPAGYDSPRIISVAASNSQDERASFSNRGANSVDVAAPGKYIYSCIPVHFGSYARVIGSSTFTAAGIIYSGMTSSTGVSGVLYDCGQGHPSEFPAGVSGYIALIEQDNIGLDTKVANAMEAGAVGVVIYNNTGGSMFGATLRRPNRWIPTVGISQTDGQTLLAQVGQSMTVVNRAQEATAGQLLSGTSMAAPMAAACIGVLAQHFPADAPGQWVNRLLDQVDVLPALAGVCVTGGRINLANSLDSDHDELPDWWEMQYASGLSVMDAASNQDGDALTDLEEYRTQTNPNDPLSQWRVVELLPPLSSNELRLTWPSQTNGRYRVMASLSLTSPDYQPIADDIAATPPLNEWTAPPVNPSNLFYRVEAYWD